MEWGNAPHRVCLRVYVVSEEAVSCIPLESYPVPSINRGTREGIEHSTEDMC